MHYLTLAGGVGVATVISNLGSSAVMNQTKGSVAEARMVLDLLRWGCIE